MARSPVFESVCRAVVVACFLLAPSRGVPQVQPVRPPMQQGERVAIGGDLDRYRAMWGSPEFRALDDESAKPWPHLQNIRTVGTFSEIPGKGRDSGASPFVGRLLEFDSRYTSHMVCGHTRCLAIRPVFEMNDALSIGAASWRMQEVEIIGAFDDVAKTMPGQDAEPPTWAFLVWSIGPAATGVSGHSHPQAPTLESLVRSPEAADGRSVTVRGVFRGSNLFGDLPDETRRQPSDWVLRDGAFSVWVSGREPKGSGWALDSRSRGDCRLRLEVRGRVETAGGYVYLRAKELTLLGPVRDDDLEPAEPRRSQSTVAPPDR